MDSPEVWMLDAPTPLRASTLVMARTASFAWRSAPATDDPLVCTPIDSTSWLGAPDTLPVPVTVMRAPGWPGAAAAVSAVPPADGEALVWAAPIVNAPMSSPAEARPAATPRCVEESRTPMVPLPCRWDVTPLRRARALPGSRQGLLRRVAGIPVSNRYQGARERVTGPWADPDTAARLGAPRGQVRYAFRRPPRGWHR